ncbi:mechanosensitive ion channel family protein [Ktedonosporobacter rubrisoli]|nr:mechanosensitive ion channel domain-containing protein [Ktedonosporobacter rubrisoli]
MVQILRIALIIIILLAALGIGLRLRRMLIARLKKTVLDNWIIQTLGVIAVIPSIVVALLLTPIIYDWAFDSLPRWLNVITGNRFNPQYVIPFLGNILESLLLIALGIGIARTAQKLAIHRLGENRIDINIRMLIGRIFYVSILVFTGFWILSLWQISIGIPVAAVGLVTVAITVSIQDILKDLVAGFYILLERPFRIGDQVTIATHTGKVEDVQLRATKLHLMSGEEVSIPNAQVFGGIVVNNTFYLERRATIAVTLPEENFVPDETANQIISAFNDIDGVMAEPAPTAMFSSFAEQKITLTVRLWIAQGQLSTLSDVMYALHKRLPFAELAVKEPAGNV